MSTKKKASKKGSARKVESTKFVRSAGGRWHKEGKRAKKKGQRVVAFRAPDDVVAAFVKKHGSTEGAWHVLKLAMSRATGISLSASEDE